MDWNDIVKSVNRSPGTKWGDDEEKDADFSTEAENYANSKAAEGQVKAETEAETTCKTGSATAVGAEATNRTMNIGPARLLRAGGSVSDQPDNKYWTGCADVPRFVAFSPTKSYANIVKSNVELEHEHEHVHVHEHVHESKVTWDKISTGPCSADAGITKLGEIIGDRIGLQSAQSVMMSATQNNLSHFHTAGMANLQYSVHAPSAAEAMDFVYNQKNTGMKFTSSSLSERELRKYLVGASLGSFVLTVGSSFTDLPDRENIWYEALGKQIDKNTVLRIYIDYNKMYDHGLTLYDLAHESFGEDCVWHVSPDFMGMIDVVVGDTLMSQWLSRMKTKVCGKFSILSCNRTLSNVNSNNFATTGTDMLAVCRIPGVDKRTVEMNNVLQVERHLGIEAAAKVLYNLIGNSEQNTPNKGKIISDFMARTGNILPFSKRSSEIRYKGVLTSMGFERPKDDIKREIHAHASGSGQKRSTPFASKSVYEYIMNGKDIPVGFDII
jgi:hypothetical protein